MLPDELKKAVESMLSSKIGSHVKITDSKAIGGGCINEAFALKTATGKYFLKYNSATAFPAMFVKEAAGLKILTDTNTITLPNVIGNGESGKYAFLLLEYFEGGVPDRNFWVDFGTKLANLHRNTNEYFGLNDDNYIGSLVQGNKETC